VIVFDKKKVMNELGLNEDIFKKLLKTFFIDAESEIKKLVHGNLT